VGKSSDVDFEELMEEVREGIQLAQKEKNKNPSGKDQLEELKRSESEDSMAGIGDSLRKFHFSAKKGLELFKRGDIVAAVSEFDTAISFNSSQPLVQRGIALYCLGRYKDAATQLKRDIERVESSKSYKASDLRLWLSACLNHLGEAKAAVDILELNSYSHQEGSSMIETSSIMKSLQQFFAKEKPLEQLLDEIGANGDENELGKDVQSKHFYGNFYMGLFYESTGENEMAKALLGIPASSSKYSETDMWFHVPRFLLNRI